jgi:hypothetical protein
VRTIILDVWMQHPGRASSGAPRGDPATTIQRDVAGPASKRSVADSICRTNLIASQVARPGVVYSEVSAKMRARVRIPIWLMGGLLWT